MSGFLLTRAAQLPPIVAISVAVVAVRGLSVGRGVFRYVEQLASHDAAFRVLADVRVRVYRRLARLAPAAHLDPPSRQALTADLLAATEGRATLFITHELDGLDRVDEIVVLDHGAVAERGTHGELRAAGGLYQRMWAAARAQEPAG